MTLLEMLLIVCPLVFFASFVDAIAGGGGLISLPAYLLSGMPAHMAIGSNKFSAAIGTAVSTARFLKSGNLHLKIALETAFFALLGSAAGALLALQVIDYYLRLVMLVALPCIAFFVLFRKRQFTDISRAHLIAPVKMFFLAMVVGYLLGMYDGFFGPGTGTFLIIAYTALMKFDLKTACGNTKVVNFASNIAALVVFMAAGQVYYQVTIPATLFSIAGNWLGSGLAIQNGARFIRPVMFSVLCLLLIKIGYDLFC